MATQQQSLIPDPEWLPGDGKVRTLATRRRLKALALFADGMHPLTGGPLHERAAQAKPLTEIGTRCGTCRFRRDDARGKAKCWFGQVESGTNVPPRVTSRPASDVAAWWSACADYQPAHTPVDHVCENGTNGCYRCVGREPAPECSSCGDRWPCRAAVKAGLS